MQDQSPRWATVAGIFIPPVGLLACSVSDFLFTHPRKFVPIEDALMAALEHDPTLAVFALRNKVTLLSPTNFLATMRTVGSVWAVHRQNANAQEIARRAGLLYDKFAGFVDNLQQVGSRLRQAQQSYESAFGQLTTGAGNLLRQTEMLRELGARTTKAIAMELQPDDSDADPG